MVHGVIIMTNEAIELLQARLYQLIDKQQCIDYYKNEHGIRHTAESDDNHRMIVDIRNALRVIRMAKDERNGSQ